MFQAIPARSELSGPAALVHMQRHLPLEITFTVLWNHVMEEAHRFHNLSFDVSRADDIIAWKEVGGHSDQSLPGPATEPVHSATWYQARKFQRPGTELLANLSQQSQEALETQADYNLARESCVCMLSQRCGITIY